MEIAFKDAQSDFGELFNPFKDEEFWYAFLEQTVQTYSRLVDDGTIIDPPAAVLSAIKRLNILQTRYEFPTKQHWIDAQDFGGDFNSFAAAAMLPIPFGGTVKAIQGLKGFETYKNYRERLNLEAVKISEDDAKIVLGEMVKNELNLMGEKFLNNLKTMNIEPKYNDIDYYVLTNFTQGGIGLDLDKEIIEIEETSPSGPSYGTTSNVANHVHTYQVDEDGNGWAYEAYNPLDNRIYHKHRIIAWTVQAAQSECYPSCKDLFGFEGVGPHDHYISNMIVPIGDIEPIGYDFEMSTLKPFVVEKYVSIDGSKYTPEQAASIIQSYDPIANISDIYPGTLEQVIVNDEVVGLVGQLGVRNGLQFSMIVDNEKYEITSVESDVLDYQIQQYMPLQANSKELLCLIKLLKNDDKFRLMNRYIMPINKLLSTLAIYNDMAFLPSIGETTVPNGEYFGNSDGPGVKIQFDDIGNVSYLLTEGWASAKDRKPSGFSGWFVTEWDNWDQVLLRNSKASLKSLFKTYYNSRTFEEDIEQMMSHNPVKFSIQNLKDRLKPNLGKTILPLKKRMKVRSNPFDSKGNLCEK
ncbi:MAG: hypothetical protein CMA12_00900 [Euryarchaeota archaeon]|nr:hypothetical protein [Euryarchaeota archaeon]